MIRGISVRVSAVVGFHGRRPVTEFELSVRIPAGGNLWQGEGWLIFPIVQSHLVAAAAAIAPPGVAATTAAASGVGCCAPLSAEGWSLHGAVTRRMLAIAATELIVAVSTSIATSLVSVASPIWSAVPSVAATVVASSAISVVVVSAVVPAAVAILIPPHASTRPTSGRHTGSVGCLHLLLRQGFLHLNFVSIDGVEFDHNRFVGSIVVGEVNKAEASLLSGLLLRDDFGLLDLTVLGEVFAQVVLFDVVLQASDEDLLHLSECLWLVGVFSGHGTFHLDRVAVDGVGPSRHCCVGLLWRRVGHKAEAAGPLQLLVDDDDAVGERTVLLEVLAQAIIVSVHVEATDEEFTKLVTHFGITAS